MSEGPEIEIMSGTEEKLNYMVVAKNGSVALGVRPLVHYLSNATLIMARVRSCRSPSNDPKSGRGLKAAGLTAAWPDIKFNKTNDERASVIVAGIIPRLPSQGVELLEAVSKCRMANSLTIWLSDHVDQSLFVIDPGVLRMSVEEAWKDMIGLAVSFVPQITKLTDPLEPGAPWDYATLVVEAQQAKEPPKPDAKKPVKKDGLDEPKMIVQSKVEQEAEAKDQPDPQDVKEEKAAYESDHQGLATEADQDGPTEQDEFDQKQAAGKQSDYEDYKAGKAIDEAQKAEKDNPDPVS